MAYCRICHHQGVKVEGGPIGVCFRHAQRRCDQCGGVSLGEELCAVCENRVAALRREVAARDPLNISPDEDLDVEEMRRLRLHQSKLFFHEAVEVVFRGLLAALQALHGAKRGGAAVLPLPKPEKRKAA